MTSAADNGFRQLTKILAILLLGLVITLLISMIYSSRLSISQFGFSFVFSSTWDPVKEVFGALPFIYGTLVSSLIALAFAVPISLGVAVFLTEQCPIKLRPVILTLVELLAAIPSVAYGLWGIFVLVPFMREVVNPVLGKTLGFLPLFQGPAYGIGLLTSGLILAVMIVPITTAISVSSLTAVDPTQREAALALGATRWEATQIMLLNARSGILGGVILGLGRALGETMAVTMVIGNRPEIAASLLAPAYTMASVIANEFAEATYDLYLHALIEIGVLLFILTFIVQGLAQLLIRQITKGTKSNA
ncbi:MAG: phosphate ABC transporter permease subunit PstC [Blastocatellia bacterium]|nr:phosphate ABC transporter permease subunit PstC [Blastocatellia bacterium]MBL8196876.1 phosphate ABC transporter permease subunit PstC [Blastocatellia bacterium]MBN8724016.1 phosphate ABC transporter permease subunit PstC [Acidobacteriota bacterium]